METRFVKIYFTINYRTTLSEELIILGNIEELGNWNIHHGFRLTWHNNHDWSNALKLEYNPKKAIEYKYVVYNTATQQVKWEEGDNRILDFRKLKDNKNDIFLKELWEHRLIKLRIKYDCGERRYMNVCLGIPGMNFTWKNPARLTKIVKKDPFTSQKTEFWQKELSVKHDIKRFRYRYVISDVERNTEIWEREPDRKCDLSTQLVKINDDSHSPLVEPNKKDCIFFERKHNEYIKVDVNFVANFFYNQINDNIFIGPYPQTTEEIDELHKAGIKAVLNLQTRTDMRHRSVDWEYMRKYYESKDIKAVNFEILDMNKEDMELKAYQAATHLKELIESQKKVYVHSTAGIGRAPQTVVSYLIFFQEWHVEEAMKFVKEKRPTAWINKDAIWGAYSTFKDKEKRGKKFDNGHHTWNLVMNI